jgi:hypothetical protein
MQLPKTELMTFDGDPLKYWLFVCSFDNIVERALVDDTAKGVCCSIALGKRTKQFNAAQCSIVLKVIPEPGIS